MTNAMGDHICIQLLDNVFQIMSWIKNKFGLEEATLRKQFQIPENFDYVDN